MIRGGTTWYQTDGCAKQYRCSTDYYMIYFLSQSYHIFIDRSVDTPGHGKYLVDGFNTVQTRYLATFQRMNSTPELDNILSKRMHVHAMTEKGEVSFAKEFKRILEHCDEIGTKGDKKYAKRKSKERLK